MVGLCIVSNQTVGSGTEHCSIQELSYVGFDAPVAFNDLTKYHLCLGIFVRSTMAALLKSKSYPMSNKP